MPLLRLLLLIVFVPLAAGADVLGSFAAVRALSHEKAEQGRAVQLDGMSRQQQVNNGCFPDLAAVPAQAITLTYQTLMAAKSIIGIVPGAHKARAVKATLHDPVSPSRPATILRSHPSAVLYLDEDSASLL